MPPGFEELSVTNEGLVAFLYDESLWDAIHERAPSILFGFRASAEPDAALLEIAKQGWLVAYELVQDDDLRLAVAVRPPLDDAEKAAWGCRGPQQAFLHLPTGQLRLDSYNSLPTEDADTAGATAEIPPGDYLLSLYRSDGGEIATLTPFAGHLPPQPGLLRGLAP